MADWCLLEGQTGEYDRLIKEIGKLNSDFSRVSPPQLNKPGATPINPLHLRPASEVIEWEERIDTLRQYRKWTGTTDKNKTIAGNIDAHFASRLKDAHNGKIKPARYDNIVSWLGIFKTWVGELAVEHFGGTQLKSFQQHLEQKVNHGEYASSYAHSILNEVKTFVRWLEETDVIPALPKGLNKLTIEIEYTPPRHLTIPEVKALLPFATGRTRLYLLLMLNTGATQKDLADLMPTEVDWETGRITRKRSKTKKQKNVPIVNYKLWRETLARLKEYGNREGDRVLLNARGNPLKDRTFKSDTDLKLKKNDSVAKAIRDLIAKAKVDYTPKMFRATSANILYNEPRFRQYHELFLDHSLKTVAQKSYVTDKPLTLDEAIDWLGEQYGIA
jgi:integrase